MRNLFKDYRRDDELFMLDIKGFPEMPDDFYPILDGGKLGWGQLQQTIAILNGKFKDLVGMAENYLEFEPEILEPMTWNRSAQKEIYDWYFWSAISLSQMMSFKAFRKISKVLRQFLIGEEVVFGFEENEVKYRLSSLHLSAADSVNEFLKRAHAFYKKQERLIQVSKVVDTFQNSPLIAEHEADHVFDDVLLNINNQLILPKAEVGMIIGPSYTGKTKFCVSMATMMLIYQYMERVDEQCKYFLTNQTLLNVNNSRPRVSLSGRKIAFVTKEDRWSTIDVNIQAQLAALINDSPILDTQDIDRYNHIKQIMGSIGELVRDYVGDNLVRITSNELTTGHLALNGDSLFHMEKDEEHPASQFVQCLCNSGKYGLIIVDSFSFFSPRGADFDNAIATQYLDEVMQAAFANNCFVLFIHHPSKTDGQHNMKFQDVLGRGASQITNYPRIRLNLKPCNDIEVKSLREIEGFEEAQRIISLKLSKNSLFGNGWANEPFESKMAFCRTFFGKHPAPYFKNIDEDTLSLIIKRDNDEKDKVDVNEVDLSMLT